MLPALEGFMTTRTNADVLIIGGGHNGLVCAAYLAAQA
jgi:glycerol-3-phosphate dehydrogenase